MADLSYILSGIDEDIIERAKSIKAIFCDVDGVLTSGGIMYDDSGKEFKIFNVKDGQIISHLRNNGIAVGVITGRESDVVKYRCNELKMDFHHHGIKDKLRVYQEEMERNGWKPSETAYIGDDLVDIPVIQKCGLGVTPADAPGYVKQAADMVATSDGGNGVLREVADIILAAQGKMRGIIDNLWQ